MRESRQEITELLEAHALGDVEALDRLFEAVYDELRRIARGQRRRGGQAPTLETTELVNELYLKLHEGDASVGRNRNHFLAIAASAVRHLLVDHARAARRDKRGGDAVRVTISRAECAAELELEKILAVDQALERLAALEPRLVRVVECRHFLGLSEAETAEVLGISLRTAQRDWRAASRWLARELGHRSEPGTNR